MVEYIKIVLNLNYETIKNKNKNKVNFQTDYE